MMKNYISGIILLFVLMACSSDPDDDIIGSEQKNQRAKVTFRIVDAQNQLLQGESAVILATPRRNDNMLVPISENTITSGSYTYNVKQESFLRLTVLKSGYNPV